MLAQPRVLSVLGLSTHWFPIPCSSRRQPCQAGGPPGWSQLLPATIVRTGSWRFLSTSPMFTGEQGAPRLWQAARTGAPQSKAPGGVLTPVAVQYAFGAESSTVPVIRALTEVPAALELTEHSPPSPPAKAPIPTLPRPPAECSCGPMTSFVWLESPCGLCRLKRTDARTGGSTTSNSIRGGGGGGGQLGDPI